METSVMELYVTAVVMTFHITYILIRDITEVRELVFLLSASAIK